MQHVKDVDWGKVDRRKVAAEVLHRIETFPETYNQAEWLSGKVSGVDIRNAGVLGDVIFHSESAAEWAACGTTACVAGHVASVAAQMVGGLAGTPQQIGTEALGLTTDERDVLFWGARSQGEVTRTLERIAAGQSPYADHCDCGCGTPVILR